MFPSRIASVLGGGAGLQNNYSLAFDGTNDVLVTTSDSTLASTTYSFWAKSSETGANAGVFGHGDFKTGAFHFNYDGARPLLYANYNPTYALRYWVDTSAQDDGKWHHWMVYVDAGDISDSKCYVDGSALSVDATTGSGTAPQAYTEALRIGGDAASGGQHFSGNIDEFAVFDGDVTSNASTYFNLGIPIDLSGESGLVAYYRMGDGDTFPTITDNSTNSNDGTMTNMASDDIVKDTP